MRKPSKKIGCNERAQLTMKHIDDAEKSKCERWFTTASSPTNSNLHVQEGKWNSNCLPEQITGVHTHTHTHTCNRLQPRTYNRWCVWMCECMFVTARTQNSEDANNEFNLLSEDKNSGNRGRIQCHTQPPNADILYIHVAPDLVYRL